MIDVKNLSKSFGNHLVLNDITEHIYPGEKVVIIGPSGSGKSTFLPGNEESKVLLNELPMVIP